MSFVLGRKKTILVVDDVPINVEVISSILKDYAVVPAASGVDALDALKSNKMEADKALYDTKEGGRNRSVLRDVT